MKKSFMTRVLAVSLSAAMAFSMSSASNLMTASAASTVSLKTTYKTLKVNQKYKMTLKKNTLGWKITKVTTDDKTICTFYGRTASSVMLKGKGVGKTKIRIKVKTTKRKYPKNIAWKTCTVNVKADDTQTPTTQAFSATAVASNESTVTVSFNQAVDNAEISNFTISDGVEVTGVEVTDDKKSATLTITGAEVGKTYDITMTGLQVAGEVQKDVKTNFTVPTPQSRASLKFDVKDPILKSNGDDTTTITISVVDANGELIKDKGTVIELVPSLGKLAQTRLSVQDGKAEVMFTSEALTVSRTAVITANVIECDNKDLEGLTGTTSITMSPNPATDTSIDAIITSATAETADRIVAYFNKEVKAEDFYISDTNKKLNRKKFTAEVRTGVANGSYVEGDGLGQTRNIVGIENLPDSTENNALVFLLDQPLIDNANVMVKFENKRSSNSLGSAVNTVYFMLSDAHRPNVMSHETNGVREIKIHFSEAVLPGDLTDNNAQKAFAADNVNNFLIDGQPLSYYDVDGYQTYSEVEAADAVNSLTIDSAKDDTVYGGTSDRGSIVVGKYDKGSDTRNVVTITLGRKKGLKPGIHNIQISNVGDWASKTDRERNIVATTNFDFTITDNTVVPTIESVTPQSPEQYLVQFNTDVAPVSDSDTIATPDSYANASVLRLQQQVGNSWVDISDGDYGSKNNIRISKVTRDDDRKNQYIVEVKRDWTEVYNTSSTQDNYFRHNLRLHIDANKIMNTVNDYQNGAIDIDLTGDIMKTPDVVSPKISGVEPASGTAQSWNVKLNEPVKLSATANGEGLTPNQAQTAGIGNATITNQGVPVGEARFINDTTGEQISGNINASQFIDADDTTINIEPARTLTAGNWTLALSAISDDIGNAIATETYPIPIDATEVASDFNIVWAAVSTDGTYGGITAGQGRYILVKFNQPVAWTGTSVNAGSTLNYTVNTDRLPDGSSIRAHILGYDDHDRSVTDSITICLPSGNYSNGYLSQYNVDGSNAILNVSRAITSVTGAPLANGGNIHLPFQFGESGVNYSGRAFSTLNTRTDAVYGNDPRERLTGYTNRREYLQALKDALEDEKYRKVIFSSDMGTLNLNTTTNTADELAVWGRSRTLTINRAVDVDLNGISVDGNVVVSTNDAVHDMILSSSAGSPVISGATTNTRDDASLTIDAGRVYEFTLSNVTAQARSISTTPTVVDTLALLIKNIWGDTFVNQGIINGNINITDANACGFQNGSTDGVLPGKIFARDGVSPANITVNGAGQIKLKGDFTGANASIAKIAVTQGATLNLVGKFTAGLEVEVTGANAKVVVDDNAVVTGVKIIAAAKDVKVRVPSGSQKGIVFLVNGGSFVQVDEKDNVITSGNIDYIPEINDDATGIQAHLEGLEVVNGVASTASNPGYITVSAISGGSIIATISNTTYHVDGKDATVNKVVTLAKSDFITATNVTNGVQIKLTEAAKTSVTTRVQDRIIVKMTCNGVTVTKTLYITIEP